MAIRRLTLARAALTAAVGLAVGGCGGPPSISVSADRPTLLTHDVSGRGDDAGFQGYLRYLPDADCFVMDPEPGGDPAHRSVVVWPPGTQVWLNDGLVAGVDVPDVGQVPVDAPVGAGGAFVERDNPEVDLPEVNPGCLAGDGGFAMFHRVNPPG